MKLEIVGTTLEDVAAISESKADRIEFCSHMEKGGLTPKYRLVKKALKIKNAKPIKVMIRPTDKTFNYSKWEYFKMWCAVVKFSHKKKIDGLVFGILTKDNDVDINRMGPLIQICKRHRKTVTFHKAFDKVANYSTGLDTLYELGVETVLTNGGTTNVDDQLAVLKEMKELNKVTILAGGGINEKNCKAFSKVADEIHVGSAVRADQNWKEHIDVAAINRIKDKIN